MITSEEHADRSAARQRAECDSMGQSATTKAILAVSYELKAIRLMLERILTIPDATSGEEHDSTDTVLHCENRFGPPDTPA